VSVRGCFEFGIGKSGSPFGVVYHRDFRYGGVLYGTDNLLNPAGNRVVIGNFTALAADLGRNIFDNNDTASQICGKGGKTFP
jgi:hypothetical protein